MTLFKQMALMLSLFLGIILVSVMVLNFKTAREFVQDQLYTNAKNTAHSLGLSLSKIADPTDVASMETMINAIYDSGYYERIALMDVDGKALYVRDMDVRISDVPQWFISYVTIHAAHASSEIMMGWSKMGTLEVSGHTGNAYRQLYHTLIDLIKTFFAIGCIVLGLLYLLLTLSLQSLKQIREQARGIIENRFIIEPKMPFTTEFRSATAAMNAMVSKVKDIFERENETLVKYNELLYKDPETKLYNRRYLITKLSEYLKSDTQLSQGLYVMLSVDELDRFKKEKGYEVYVGLIRLIVEGLINASKLHEHSLLVRLNEGDFFLLLPLRDDGLVKKHIDTMLQLFKEHIDHEALSYVIIGVGMGTYNENDSLKTLLSRSDFTVAQAKQKGEFHCEMEIRQHHALVLSREEWRSEIVSSIKESRFILASQQVFHILQEGMSIVHQEVFVRLRAKDGSVHSAGVFIPMAATLGLVDEIDRYMIDKIFNDITLNAQNSPIAINLSAEFVKHYANIQWLKIYLSKVTSEQRPSLWFEVSNSIALHNLEAVISLSSTLKMFGHRFGIDSFTIPDEGAYYLQAIRPDYVKSTAAYLKDMMVDATTGKNQESLNNLTKSLGITIIATNIENEKDLNTLKNVGIGYFQGRFLAGIELLEGNRE